MKPILTIALFIFFTINSIAQYNFVEGYFITNNDEQINCLIKNYNWVDSPTKIEYKLNENSVEKTITKDKIKEFSLTNYSKFIRKTVDIDKSSRTIKFLSKTKKGVFKKETIFLKVMLEGKANLYQYRDLEKDQNYYFFNVDNEKVKQLLYKKAITKDGYITYNNSYKQQLSNSLKCENITQKSILKMDYTASALLKIFKKYNTCQNSNFTNHQDKLRNNVFRLTTHIGAKSILFSDNISIANSLGFRIGFDLEYLIPLHKNKSELTVFIEPTYQSFNGFTKITPFKNQITHIRYVTIPIGTRYYHIINKKSSVSTDFAVNLITLIPKTTLGNKEYYSDGKLADNNFSTIKYTLGLGYNYKKFSLGVKLHFNENSYYLHNGKLYNSYNKTGSIIFGYRLF